ncbi:MAG: AsmA family protein [Bacteroidales bacterium]|nr:AsmA family protein [Bacteroidales bacterium]
MKKVFKIFTIVVAGLLTLVILLSVVAKIKENEIADIALKKISKSINASLFIEDISFNLIRRFPLATVELEGVLLSSPGIMGMSDTLISDDETIAQINTVYVSVKTIPLFKGKFEIMKVEIKGAEIEYIVDRYGVSNLDFLTKVPEKDTADHDTVSIGLNLFLKELLLKDIHCDYYDSLKLINAQLKISKAEVTGKIKDNYLFGSIEGELKLNNCGYKDTKLNLMKETEIELNITYKEDTVDIRELTILTDGAHFDITGSAILGDTIETDIRIQGTKMNVDELAKYIPQKTLNKIGLKKISGVLNLDATAKGPFSDSLLPEIDADITINNGLVKYADYPALRNISLNVHGTNGKEKNNKTTSIIVRKFHAETERSNLDISASIRNLDRIQYNITSDININLGDFTEFIPDTVLLEAKGRLRAIFKSKGIIPDCLGRDFTDYLLDRSQLDLTLNNVFIELDSTLTFNSISGQITYDLHNIIARDFQLILPKYKMNVNNMSFDAQLSGKISEPAEMGIDMKSYQIKTDSCAVYGSLNMKNLKIPEYSLMSNMKINLGEIHGILPDALVKEMSGEITARITSGGKLNPDSIADQVNDLVFKNSTYDIDFSKISIEMPDTLMSVMDLTGNVNIEQDTVKITNLKGVYNGADFGIDSAIIVNLYNSVIQNQASRLYVEGRFNLGDLDYSMIAPFIKKDKDADKVKTLMENTETLLAAASARAADTVITTKKDNDTVTKNYTFSIKGKLRVKSFTYNKAVADNISALFNLRDSLYLVDQFKFNGFKGKHNTSLKYSIKDDERTLWVKNKVEGMDVNQLLRDFDNFSEYYKPEITYENVTGILSSEVHSQILIKGDSLIRNKMYVKGDVKLEKGGIYNYPPLKEMEPYLPGIDNLNKLEFKTINSNIFVFQDAIYVPTTLVVSNKLDAQALGMQGFGEDYSYHFMVFLSDLLTGKSDRITKKQDKGGDDIADDGRKGTRVRSYSEKGKRRSGLDSEKNWKEMERKVKASEALLNLRFHPHIVNYNTGVE